MVITVTMIMRTMATATQIVIETKISRITGMEAVTGPATEMGMETQTGPDPGHKKRQV
jgi:hypothetical protein